MDLVIFFLVVIVKIGIEMLKSTVVDDITSLPDNNWTSIMSKEILTQLTDKLNKKYNNSFHTSVNAIVGNINDFKISISKNEETNYYYYNIIINYNLLINSTIHITNETASSTLKKSVGFDDILTGDKLFDKKMLLESSNPLYIIAFLNNKVRKTILGLERISKTIIMDNSRIITHLPYSDKITVNSLFTETMILISLCEDLIQSKNLKRRLKDNIITETDPDVRLKNIESLATNFSIDQEVKEVFEQALDDQEIRVQVEVAQYLDEQGMQHLVTSLQTNNKIPGRLRNRIINILAAQNYTESIPFLKSLLLSSTNNKQSIEILKAFTSFATTELNDFLLELFSKKDSEMHSAIIEALATCGETSAIATLTTYAKGSINPLVRASVSKTIDQIQARNGTVEKGWLSISELSEKEGALSISDTPEDSALIIREKKKLIKDDNDL